PADAIGQEPVLHAPPPDQPAAKPRKAAKKAVQSAATREQAATTTLPATLRISNPDRGIDAASGFRKIELVRYYTPVTPLMTPHLKDRPIAMVRAPDGIEGQLFFQKHLDRYKMAGVEALDPAIFPGHPPMVYIARPEGILAAAQMNVIEIHT